MLGLSRRELAGLVALFVVTLPAVTPRLYSSDEVQYFSYLRSLWFDHDVSFENEYRYFYDRGVARTPGFEATFLRAIHAVGPARELRHDWQRHSLGAVLRARRHRRASRARVRARDRRRWLLAALHRRGDVRSAVYGFLAILLSTGVARRVTGYGLAPALIVWVGTPLLFYMYAAPPLFACVLGICRGAVRDDLASCAERLVAARHGCARCIRRAHGHGSRAGHLLRAGTSARLRLDVEYPTCRRSPAWPRRRSSASRCSSSACCRSSSRIRH